MERLTTELTELKSGGKFNPKALESLEVSTDKSGLETKKLREMAQLVVKGRYINIILYDQAVRSSLSYSHTLTTAQHVKAVKSAIQRSDLSLNPQGPTADAPTTLAAQIPPPTAESRAAAQGDAKKAYQKTVERVQDARAAKHKKLQELKTSRALRDDDFRKAHKEMEEVVQKGARAAKRLWDDAKKAIESGS
jgi:ribosome recycling factor